MKVEPELWKQYAIHSCGYRYIETSDLYWNATFNKLCTKCGERWTHNTTTGKIGRKTYSGFWSWFFDAYEIEWK